MPTRDSKWDRDGGGKNINGPGSDLGCVPNLVVVGPAVLAKNTNKQTDRQTDMR